MTLSTTGRAFIDPYAGYGPVTKNLAQNFRDIFKNARGGSTQGPIDIYDANGFQFTPDTLLPSVYFGPSLY